MLYEVKWSNDITCIYLHILLFENVVMIYVAMKIVANDIFEKQILS